MLTSTLALIASLGLVVANAFFVASEFALVKMRPTRLQQLAAKGNRRARMALDISKHLDAYLSANQLGITLASLALGWLGEPAFAALLRPLFASLGSGAAAAAHTIAIVCSFIIITFLHTVLGELAPKSLAIQRTEPVALWTAAPLRVFYLVMFPLIWTLNKASALTLRLLRLRPPTENELAHSPEELRLVLHHVPIEPGARRLIDRVFDYTRRVARHVMTLRRDVMVLDVDLSFDDTIKRVLDGQFTRYPLHDSKQDRIVGYVHAKDLMAAMASQRRPRLIDLVREPVYATEDTPLEEIRRHFQRRSVHLAVIKGKDGEFAGIVTLEDLLEEFVGEIRDEQDVGEVPPILAKPDGGFEVDGRITLDVIARDLGLAIQQVPEGVETIGGYVMSRVGAMPLPGDQVEVDGFRMSVMEVRDRRVRRLRVDRLAESVVQSTDAAASP
jgi:CBS domain containing-hemolysin-like protein